MVAAVVGDHRKRVERRGGRPFVPDALCERKRILPCLIGTFQLGTRRQSTCQLAEREDRVPVVAELVEDRQGLLECRHGRAVVRLGHRLVSGCPEGPCANLDRQGVCFGEAACEQAARLGDVTVSAPEAAERGHRLQRLRDAPVREAPVERRAHVVELPLRALQPFGLFRPRESVLGLLGEREEALSVPPSGVGQRPVRGQARDCVLTHRLEHGQPHCPVAGLTPQQAPGHEASRSARNRSGDGATATRVVERAAPCEHRKLSVEL